VNFSFNSSFADFHLIILRSFPKKLTDVNAQKHNYFFVICFLEMHGKQYDLKEPGKARPRD